MPRRKLKDFANVPSYGLTSEAAAAALGSHVILEKLEAARELEPFYKTASLKLYRTADVARAFARFADGQTSIPLS